MRTAKPPTKFSSSMLDYIQGKLSPLFVEKSISIVYSMGHKEVYMCRVVYVVCIYIMSN